MTRVAVANAVVVNDDDRRGHGEAGGGCGQRGQPDDAQVLNELLRISYNFADGARALIGLVVGICDLKPLIFWLTIASQFELAERFGELPFALVGKAKPSLDRYGNVISGARNRAFHDLFSFGRPFHVRLTGDAFRAAELRLFQDYRHRQSGSSRSVSGKPTRR